MDVVAKVVPQMYFSPLVNHHIFKNTLTRSHKSRYSCILAGPELRKSAVQVPSLVISLLVLPVLILEVVPAQSYLEPSSPLRIVITHITLGSHLHNLPTPPSLALHISYQHKQQAHNK